MRRLCLTLGLLVFLGGCTFVFEEPSKDEVSGIPVNRAAVSTGQKSDMFSDASQSSHSNPIQAAVDWKDRYDTLYNENQSHLKQIEDLKEVNLKLNNEAVTSRAELNQVKSELEQANTFMQQMNDELLKWKTDILGNRDEIKKVHETQLKALAKILELLGAGE